MKQISLISLFLLLMLSINTLARHLPSHPGDADPTMNHIQNDDKFSRLMGLDEWCGDEEEWCEKRRMVAEAHLDYIYTQHQHP